MYIDDNCNICASCAFFAGNVCAAYQCELKDLIGTWCKFLKIIRMIKMTKTIQYNSYYSL